MPEQDAEVRRLNEEVENEGRAADKAMLDRFYGENGLLLCGLQRGHDGGHALEGWQGTADGEGRRL